MTLGTLRNLTIALSVIGAGCSAGHPLEGKWELVSINSVAFPARTDMQIDAKGSVSGSAPCNRYFGMLDGSGSTFGIAAIGATRRACPDLQLEGQYFKALGAMKRADLDGAHLTLSTPDGDIMLFKSVSPTP